MDDLQGMLRTKQELLNDDCYGWNSSADDDVDDSDCSFSIPDELCDDDLSEESDFDYITSADHDESIQPISFDADMDYANCMSYYALMASQEHGGGMVRRVRPLARLDRVRSSSLFDGECSNQAQLRSCLRNSTRRKTASPPPVLRRRFSFSGVPVVDQDPLHTSTSYLSLPSKDDTTQVVPRRVCFTDHVRVKRHPSIIDYSADTREKLWISREELLLSMERASIAPIDMEQEPSLQQKESDSARAA
jgi:hypothetical protein